MRRHAKAPFRPASAPAVVAAGVLVSACGGVTAPHVVLEDGTAALRSDFLADSGTVRAIFLASPT